MKEWIDPVGSVGVGLLLPGLKKRPLTITQVFQALLSFALTTPAAPCTKTRGDGATNIVSEANLLDVIEEPAPLTVSTTELEFHAHRNVARSFTKCISSMITLC